MLIFLLCIVLLLNAVVSFLIPYYPIPLSLMATSWFRGFGSLSLPAPFWSLQRLRRDTNSFQGNLYKRLHCITILAQGGDNGPPSVVPRHQVSSDVFAFVACLACGSTLWEREDLITKGNKEKKTRAKGQQTPT